MLFRSDEIAQLKSNYATYVKNCNSLMESPIGSKGKLAAAYKQWKTAEAALEKATTEQQSMREELNAAKIAYDKKVSEAADPAKKGQDLSKEIAAKATTFAGLVMKAKDLGHGLDHDEHISALVDLLTATAGGDVNPEDPSLQRAVAVAKHIPLLAGDMAALEATRTAPPVSGLLIALRHQTLLAETEKTRAALAAERVAILKGKYDLYQQAGERWLRFFDAVCTYAVLSNNKKHPGAKCDTFEVPKIPKDTVDSITCSIDVTPLENCILSHSWKNRLAAIDTPDKPEIKRKLYEAVAAYLQALTLQARPLEQSFREIDVRHREALLAKQGAIAAWDNLVSVPFDQLDAYYKAGVKPAEIADLIVKALGFTAITIGVLQ